MNKNFTIQIENFQSLSKTELEIEDGLNIVVGKTNAGKSATLRAIDSALFNVGDDDKVRSGQRYAKVTIDNGTHKMIWKRDSKAKNEKTSYQVDDGDVITKVGRGQLPEVTTLFNISDVKLSNGIKEKINFWYQGAAPFLMDKTAGQLFEFLSQSSCDKYLKVTKKLEIDIKAQKSKIDSTNASIDAYRSINQDKKDYIDKNKGFEELYNQIVQWKNDVSKYNQLKDLIDRQCTSLIKIQFKTEVLSITKKRLETIDFGAIKIEYDNCYILTDKMDKISEYLIALDSKNNKLTTLDTSFKDVAKQFADMSNKLNDCEKQLIFIEELSSFAMAIKGWIESYQQKRDTKKALKASLLEISNKISNIDLDALKDEIEAVGLKEKELQDNQTQILAYKIRSIALNDKRDSLTSITNEYTKVTNEFDAFKKEIGYCPYCDSKI